MAKTKTETPKESKPKAVKPVKEPKLTKEMIYQKTKEFAGDLGRIKIPMIEGNMELAITCELWTEFICQILKITE